MKLPDSSPRALARSLPRPLRAPISDVLDHVQTGAFQRSMSLLVVGTSIVTGLEVGYEHYKGSYSNPVMYTPVVLSGVLAAAGVCSFFSRAAARTFLRYTSLITLLDGVVGGGFHIRGIGRKPGGWRLPMTNIVMGPPLFAPLLFGTSAYLGVIASYLRREEDYGLRTHLPVLKARIRSGGLRENIRTGQFQKHLCIVAAVAATCSGCEAWYSHYKDRFKYLAQWSPVLLSPLMVAACVGSLFSRRIANRLLPAVSGMMMLEGVVGTGYHVRGILRRPGGTKKPLYNILYGAPLFAPMLLAAAGMLGALAWMVRREKRA